MSPHIAFKSGHNLKTIINESFAVINKCIEQFDTFRDLIRDELLQRTRFAGIQVRRKSFLEKIYREFLVAKISDVNTNCQRTSSRRINSPYGTYRLWKNDIFK